ncbi:hypothetical protein SADUNF_Sadunf04G0157100 [Salix dunnii]|uniref:Uncharacterized protein n=1 Tax=Salix dunnii TaxID=1413687 RepID=A0A835KCS9_9ROSI|nr:hypothetical protein SADUNF_Sadunf04G0157100 [Salix dunnii]
MANTASSTPKLIRNIANVVYASLHRAGGFSSHRHLAELAVLMARSLRVEARFRFEVGIILKMKQRALRILLDSVKVKMSSFESLETTACDLDW